MIVLNLRCRNLHDFEGWFASSEAFADQQARGLVTCPSCGDAEITRLPAAAHIATGAAEETSVRSAAQDPAAAVAAQMGEALAALRRIVARTENVGRRFPDEARKIHYGEAPKRDIRGKATPDEARELEEEGIDVLPLPLVPDDESH
ncbi:MAG TPA: DUF1178 family protein [Rhodocyclaceae bacterium]|nr:DUF1178 family protein [Rhodocyclaceae bacterium]HNH35698.1 DUF1178 family protein [Rhodocyclaceae bacterium]